MESRCMPNGLDAAAAVNEVESDGSALKSDAAMLESDAAVEQLKAELCERKRVEEELQRLNSALEQRLTQSWAELAETTEELRQEMHRRKEDQHEIRLLSERLMRKESAFGVLSHELELFTYAISHDFRAPLRHLLGFSEALAEHLGQELDASAQGYLNCIIRAGRKMDTQVQALVALSRITRQELRLTSVDLSQLARDVAATLKSSDPDRPVAFTIADKLTVRADPVMLKIVVENLLNNAWKYTRKKDPATIELGRKQEGEETVFFLSDNGVGFDMRYAEKLFTPFQRMHAESDYEGVGAGLAMVQRIVHRHGGKIWADARVDEGATIFFTLAD
jgi:signal transduction histidine kinase